MKRIKVQSLKVGDTFLRKGVKYTIILDYDTFSSACEYIAKDGKKTYCQFSKQTIVEA